MIEILLMDMFKVIFLPLGFSPLLLGALLLLSIAWKNPFGLIDCFFPLIAQKSSGSADLFPLVAQKCLSLSDLRSLLEDPRRELSQDN